MDETRLRERLHEAVDNMSLFNVMVLLILVQAVRAIETVRRVQNLLPGKRVELPEPAAVTPEGMEGPWGCTDVVLEESAEITQETWDKLMDGVAKTSGFLPGVGVSLPPVAHPAEEGMVWGTAPIDMHPNRYPPEAQRRWYDGGMAYGMCTPYRSTLMTYSRDEYGRPVASGTVQSEPDPPTPLPIHCGLPSCRICGNSTGKRFDQ